MATLKLYLNNASPGYTPTSVQGTWNDSTPLVNKACSTSKDTSGSPASAGDQVGDGVSGHTYLEARYISDALTENLQFTSGQAWSGVIALFESSSSCNAYLYMTAWVTQGDSSTPRGVLFSNYTDANEASTGTTTCDEGCSGTLADTFVGRVGDRIVLEVGAKHNTTSTTYYSRTYYGGSGSDLADDGNGTSNVGWVSLTYVPVVDIGWRPSNCISTTPLRAIPRPRSRGPGTTRPRSSTRRARPYGGAGSVAGVFYGQVVGTEPSLWDTTGLIHIVR